MVLALIGFDNSEIESPEEADPGLFIGLVPSLGAGGCSETRSLAGSF